MILNSNSNVPSLSAPRGQKRINLREALAFAPDLTKPLDMTFGELSAAYIAVHLNGAEMQLRKWIDLLGERSAWEIAPNELARAGVAMIDNGYSPSTVNRNLSQIGSIYRWAKRRMLTPPGFISPTISQYRYE
ncbi:MAG: Phage integrase, N-terminal SAM-like domain, partial [Pseudomonadota bacterium]